MKSSILKPMVKLVPMLVLTGFSCASVAAPTDAPTIADVKALIEASGAAKIGESISAIVTPQIVAALHQSNPNLPERADGVVREVVSGYIGEQVQAGHLVDRLVPIYTEHFTEADVQQLIAFYHSPVGKKMVNLMPVISAQSARLGQEWAVSILPGLQQRLVDRLKSEKLL